MTILHQVEVSLAARSYNISIGAGLLPRAADFFPGGVTGRAVFVLTDENVIRPHADVVAAALKRAGATVHIMAVPPGEASKSMDMLQRVLSWMIDHGVTRQSALFAVGGGVVGDLGGLAASLVMRGIPYLQMPTTLLAQVDSSVGGKTAVNMKQGKNLVGAFYQPAAVICDLDTLATLPRREFLSGYAEIVKYALLGDPEFFDWLERNGAAVCAREPAALAHAVAVSCRAKAAIVAEDERETGNRALLNLGHTFGHALEAAAGYDGRLLHGEAVSIGMAMALDLSREMKLCPAEDARRGAALLTAAELPVSAATIRPSMGDARSIAAWMDSDKKIADGRKTFILLRGIGKAFTCNDVTDAQAVDAIARSLKGD
jgi:3-dehydroquinate synthase